MSTIKSKVIGLLLLSQLLIGAIAGTGFYLLWTEINRYQGIIDHEASYQRQILVLEADFKKQVQEWKNVLLRGHDDQRREKYWGQFQELEASIQNQGKGLLAELKQVGDSGSVLTQEAAELLEQFLNEHRMMGGAYRAGFNQFVEQGYDHTVGDKAVSGIDRAPTKLLDEAAIAIDELMSEGASLAKESAGRIVVICIAALLIGALVALVSAFAFSQRVLISPITMLSAAFGRLAGGDFSGDKIAVGNNDEIGQLASDANQLQENLRQVLQTLIEATDQIDASAAEMESSNQQVQGLVTSQQLQTDQVATAINEMTSTVQEVASSAQSASTAAMDANSKADHGQQVVEQTQTSIRFLAEEVQRASAVIQSVDEDSKSIGGILDVIRGIAEQTNLLALNAAIEAARAGDQGRGFAVVADEVRTLAQRTQSSTQEIQTMIEKLQGSAQNAVDVMAKGQDQAAESVGHAEVAGSSLVDIAGAIGTINDMNAQIASAAEEQSIVADDINKSVVSIAEASASTVQHMNRNSEIGAEVAALAYRLKSITQKFQV